MAPRVLVTSHLFPSPTRPLHAPWLAEQVAALRHAGVAVDVLCCSQHETDRDDVTPDKLRVAYRSTSAGMLNGTRLGLLVAAVRYRSQLRRYLREHPGSHDVVHAHFAFPDGWALAHEGERAGVPVVLTVHGSDVARIVTHAGVLGMVVRDALARMKVVVCVSKELECSVRASVPDTVKTRVIANGFDDALFSPGTGTRDLGFLFVGRLSEVKGVESLVRVYLNTPELHALPLTIAGHGPSADAIRAMVDESSVAGKVRFLDPLTRPQVADAMRRAHALVVPSLREGWGMVAAEALACGTPVVGSAVGGLPVMVRDERAGMLVEPGDEDALRDAMKAALGWQHDPATVAAASGARPWSEQAALLAALYDEVLADAAAAS